ncbi:MAG: hypothetical protein ACFFBZ_09855 [Promethearchaeota archaeon]
MEAKGKVDIPRPKYPRPQIVRKNNWININGEWDFIFDDSNIGFKDFVIFNYMINSKK